MESITKCLAANIRNLRKKHKLTQSELAERAGISLIFLQGLEAEKKWLSPGTVKAIATALQVAESKLFENCFESGASKKKIKRLAMARIKFDHVPDDIFNALATTCRQTDFTWDVIRWIIAGFESEARGWVK